jgi:hypothetical protein
MDAFLPFEELVPLEVLIGRSLAFCIHPVAAWRRLRTGGRLLLMAAYVVTSYVIALTILFML